MAAGAKIDKFGREEVGVALLLHLAPGEAFGAEAGHGGVDCV